MLKKWTLAIVIMAVSLIVATALAVNQKQNTNPAPQNRQFTPEKTISSTGQGSSCCGGGQASACGTSRTANAVSCCGGKGTGAATKPIKMLEAVQSYLYRIYAGRLQDPQITVQVKDLGCHMEALIKKDGKIVKRLSISGNTITEIS